MRPRRHGLFVLAAALGATTSTAAAPAATTDPPEVLEVRAELVAKDPPCDKYCSYEVKVLAGPRFVGKSIRVEIQSWLPGIAPGVSTLHLVLYNREQPNGPWLLANADQIRAWNAFASAHREQRENEAVALGWLDRLVTEAGDITDVTALPFAYRSVDPGDHCAKIVPTGAALQRWKACFLGRNRLLVDGAAGTWDDFLRGKEVARDEKASARLRLAAKGMAGPGTWISEYGGNVGTHARFLVRVQQRPGDPVRRVDAIIADVGFDPGGQAALKRRTDNAAFREAIGRDDPEAVRRLLRNGADPNEVGDDFAPTAPPVTMAAEKGRLRIVEILLAAGARPNRCCCSCVTALHRAIAGGHLAIVDRLLAAGADPTIPYDGKISTLEFAEEQGNPEIVRRVQDALARRALPAK